MSKQDWVVVPVITEEDKKRVDEALRSCYEVAFINLTGKWVNKSGGSATIGSIYRWPADLPEPKATPLDAGDMRSWMVMREDCQSDNSVSTVGGWGDRCVKVFDEFTPYENVVYYQLSRHGGGAWFPATKEGLAALYASEDPQLVTYQGATGNGNVATNCTATDFDGGKQ